jgi:acyl dehydratase
LGLNRALIGRIYDGGVVFDVSRQKLREFAAAIGDDAPVLHDVAAARAAGHPDLPAAPTFGAVLSLEFGQGPRRDSELGIDYSRIVHGEQRIVSRRPIYAGDVLVGRVSIEDIRAVGRNELLLLRCRVLTAEGEEVCFLDSTLVSRGTAPEPLI